MSISRLPAIAALLVSCTILAGLVFAATVEQVSVGQKVTVGGKTLPSVALAASLAPSSPSAASPASSVTSQSDAAQISANVNGVTPPAVLPYLDILSATIEELPPIVWGEAQDRSVGLQITIAAALPEDPAVLNALSLSYGFLIDADKDPATGFRDEAFGGLGVDCRVSLKWDATVEHFVSSWGEVGATRDPETGGTRLEIYARVSQLPSDSFRWIAYACEGKSNSFTRLPASPAYGTWTMLEESFY